MIGTAPENFIILTQNIRSVNCNMSGFELFLQRLKIECDVYVLTECWLSCTNVLPNLIGYRSNATQRNYIQNDGVVICYKDHLQFTFEEPNFNEGNCLIAALENQIAIIAVYRSPSYSNIDPFLLSLNDTLTKYSSFNNIVVVGDINIAINPNKIDLHGERYLNLAASHGMLPAHTMITRQQSGTCIDHILLKTKNSSTAFVLEATLTKL